MFSEHKSTGAIQRILKNWAGVFARSLASFISDMIFQLVQMLLTPGQGLTVCNCALAPATGESVREQVREIILAQARVCGQ